MAMAIALAYYNMAKITAAKSFIVQALEVFYNPKILLNNAETNEPNFILILPRLVKVLQDRSQQQLTYFLFP
jgi:hypothetical protein